MTEDQQCGRTARGVRCEKPGFVGVDDDKGGTLWLCEEHFDELMARYGKTARELAKRLSEGLGDGR
jgi:hypothetical protein